MKKLLVALTALCALSFASSASGSVTLGQLDPGTPSTECSGLPTSTDELQPTVSSGNSYVVPSKGVITAWTNRTASDPNQVLTFKVFRSNGSPSYTVVGHDGPRPLVSSADNTFPTNIPVVAGDVIGLHHGETAAESTCNFAATDTYFEREGDLPDGQSGIFHDYGPGNCCFYRLNVTAVFEPTNTFTFGQVTRNKKKGTATVALNLPNAGEVTVAGKGVKGAVAQTATAVRPGAAIVKIRTKGKQRKLLNVTGKVKVKPRITYAPTGGDPSTQTLKLKLKKA